MNKEFQPERVFPGICCYYKLKSDAVGLVIVTNKRESQDENIYRLLEDIEKTNPEDIDWLQGMAAVSGEREEELEEALTQAGYTLQLA